MKGGLYVFGDVKHVHTQMKYEFEFKRAVKFYILNDVFSCSVSLDIFIKQGHSVLLILSSPKCGRRGQKSIKNSLQVTTN